MLPDADRNAHVGREKPLGRALAWAKNCATFPLLVPSLVICKALDAFDRI